MAVPPPPPPPPKPAGDDHKSSFSFSSSKPQHVGGPSPEMVHQVSDVNRRVRMVEESLSNLRKKVELENENTLSDKRSVNADIQGIYEELEETKKTVRTIQETVTKMIKELQSLAKKEDVQVLQKYVNIWKPIQFVTQQEVEAIVRDELAKMQQTGYSQPRQQPQFSQPQQSSAQEYEDTIIQEPVDEDEQPESDSTNAENEDEQEIIQNQSANLTQNTTTTQTHTPSDEQKRRIAQFIEAHEDVKELLIHDIDAFVDKVANDDMLQVLFKGVDLHSFSEKLQKAYDITPKKVSKTASRNEEIFGHHSSTKLDEMLRKQ